METYKPFSIIVVPFPFTDKKEAKRRPALVLSTVEHQEETDHITLVMITSAKRSKWNSDYEISQLETTGLDAPSIIRQKIFTIDNRLVIKNIGFLTAQDRVHLLKKVNSHLSLNLT